MRTIAPFFALLLSASAALAHAALDAGGAVMSTGKAQAGADRRQLRVPLKPLAAGTYKVIWRILSVDTHRAQGDFTFRVGP
jgi:copper resistance protein C